MELFFGAALAPSAGCFAAGAGSAFQSGGREPFWPRRAPAVLQGGELRCGKACRARGLPSQPLGEHHSYRELPGHPWTIV